MLSDFSQAILSRTQAFFALETKGPCDNRDRQNAHFTRHLRDNGRSTRAGPATHASGNKDHIRTVQRVGNTIPILERCSATYLWVGPSTQTFGNTRPQLEYCSRADI